MAIQALKCIQKCNIVKCQTVASPHPGGFNAQFDVVAKFYDFKYHKNAYVHSIYNSIPKKKVFRQTTHSYMLW